MIKKIAIVITMFFVSGITLKAQDKLVLTLDKAKEYALEYNRALIKSGLSIQAAQAQLWQTISQGLPQIDGTVDYNNNLGAKASLIGQTIDFKPSSSAQITASQLIFSGNYLVGIELSKLSKKLIESNQTKTILEIKKDITSTFFNILLAELSKEILEKNIANVKDTYRKIEASYKAGVIEETEVDQLSIQLSTLENMLKSSERQIEMAYNLLRLQLGTTPHTPIELEGNLEGFASNANIDALLEKNMDIENNINYQLMKQQENILEKQVKFQKSSYLPTLAAFYNFNYKLLKPDLDFAPKHTVGLKASIPIFSGGNRYNKVKEAKLNLKSIQVDLSQVNDELTIMEKQLRFNLQTAYDQYITQQKNIAISRKVYNSLKLKYEQGLLSSLDLTTANNNYLQAENSYISAMHNLVLTKAELEKLLGTL